MKKKQKQDNVSSISDESRMEQSQEEIKETPVSGNMEETTVDPLDAALKEIETLKSKLLYTTAEFDNYRKRTVKEKSELILNGSSTTMEALLPVIDDMERALQGQEDIKDVEVLKEGQQLIYKKMLHVLNNLGLREMDTTQQLFDVDMHEAVAMVPTDNPEDKGKVIDCIQKGYTLNGKVLRHAKVAVGQ